MYLANIYIGTYRLKIKKQVYIDIDIIFIDYNVIIKTCYLQGNLCIIMLAVALCNSVI